jgi:hypothetical protein
MVSLALRVSRDFLCRLTRTDRRVGKKVFDYTGIAVAMCNVATASQNTYPESAFSNLTCPKCSDQNYICLAIA